MRFPWPRGADRRRWRSARSLPELGELTALWLEGEIRVHPGCYQAKCGPDDETLPLVPVLAAANRAGFVTLNSQPGTDPETGYDGQIWAQRAAVEGLLTDRHLASALIGAAETAGLLVAVHDGRRGKRDGITVTERAGKPCTAFGHYYRRRALRGIWPGIGPGAFDEVAAAVQVTLAAPEYGSAGQRLWDVLQDALPAGQSTPAGQH